MELGRFLCFSIQLLLHNSLLFVKSKQMWEAAVRILPALCSVLFSKHVKVDLNTSLYLELNVGNFMMASIVFHNK